LTTAGQQDGEQKRAAGIRRTVIILVLVALSFYIGFFLFHMYGK